MENPQLGPQYQTIDRIAAAMKRLTTEYFEAAWAEGSKGGLPEKALRWDTGVITNIFKQALEENTTKQITDAWPLR